MHNPENETRGFGFMLHDVSRMLRRHFEKRTSVFSLTHMQSFLLTYLSHNEGINQSALADMMDIEPIALVGMLDKLEDTNWLERRPDPNDRRARLLYLSTRAQPLLADIRTIGADIRKQAFVGIPVKDQRQLMKILERVKANLSAHDERSKK